jgi:twitching motility protein PilJ
MAQATTKAEQAGNIFDRLTLPQKLMTLCVIATIPVLIPLYLYYKGEQKYIDITTLEQVALPPSSVTQDFISAVQKHRDLAFSTLSGNDKSEAGRENAKIAVESQIAKMDAIIANFEYPGLAETWKQSKDEWGRQAIVINNKAVDADKGWEEQTKLIKQLSSVQELILAGSTMDLDPDAETYYTISNTLVNFPAIAESMAQIRHIGTKELASEKARTDGISQDAKLELTVLTGRAADLAAVSKGYVERAVANFPDLKARMYSKTMEAIASVEETNKLTTDQIINSRTASYSANDYLAKYNQGVDQQTAVVTAGIDSINKEFNRQIGATKTRLWTTFFITLAVVAGVFILAALISRFISNSVTNPITYLVGVMNKLASGDTTARANIQTFDEIGALGRQFDMMVDQREIANAQVQKENDTMNNSIIDMLQAVGAIAQKDLTIKAPVAEDITGPLGDALNYLTDETAKVLNRVVQIAGDVSNVSKQVKTQSDTVLGIAADEKREVDQSAIELGAASVAMLDIAQLAMSCNQAAAKAIVNTDKAQETVLGTVQGITSIRDTIRETEKRIKRLGERSQEIGSVVTIINSIAERTHILALNASMHAASAGEAGKGFAVVANEVQKLAENAREATLQISGLVNNIQVETADTVTNMNDAITQVVRGTTLAQQAGNEMRETRDTTSELAQLVQRIADSSKAQAETSQRLQERSVQIQKASAQTFQQLQEQGIQTDRLVGFSGNLVESVGVFKLPKAS